VLLGLTAALEGDHFDFVQGFEERRPAWSAGPTLSFGLRPERDRELEISVRWAPLFDGARDRYAARLELAFLEWIALALEVERLAQGGELFLAGVGGRLPW